jgi:hypothetical protein
LPAGRFCRNGGFRIEFGLDINKNLQLDPNEVNNLLTKYVCNGINGRGIVSTIDNGNGTFTFTYSDGTTFTTSDLRGPQGPQGIQGPAGAAGVGISSTTDNGNGTFTINYSDGSSFTTINLTGPQGPQGIQGAIGPQGPIGQTGAQGSAGANGNGIISTINNGNGTYTFNYSDGSSFTTSNLIGSQGIQGPIGPQGPAGNNGQNGIGITNSYVQGDSLFVVLSNGQILNTGYVRGSIGQTGPQGLIGATGPQGPIGVTGAQGPVGLTGPQGATGATGAQGPIGLTGPQGPAGATGPQGPAGILVNGNQGQTLYHNGTTWVATSNLYNNGTNVAVGNSNPDNSAAFQVSSTAKGVLLPSMTLTQRNTIPSPATGLLIFQIDSTPGFYYYNGSAWVAIAGSGSGSSGSGSNPNTLIYTTDGF